MGNVYEREGALKIGSDGWTQLFAKASISSATTDGAIVTAVTGKSIRVIGFIVSPAGTTTAVTFNSKPAGSGTAISATFTALANSPFSAGVCEFGWFQTNQGEGLTATTGVGSTTGFQVVYILV